MKTYTLFRILFFLVTISGLQPKTAAGIPISGSNLYYYHKPSWKPVCLTPVPDTGSLRKAVVDFIAKADSGKIKDVINYYDSNFLSVRVVDAGQFIKMDYNQMVSFWKMLAGRQTEANASNRKAIISTSTVIHNLEIIGDTGYVILTRVKDFGNGNEPVFYVLIWVYKNNKWYLLREIVHQRTMPKFH